MEATARKKFLRVSPRKLRLLADAVRGKGVETAVNTLRFSKKKFADEMARLIHSAVNNAAQDRAIDADELYVKSIFVDQGPTMKRIMPRARGSADRILKRMSHLTVVVGRREENGKKG